MLTLGACVPLCGSGVQLWKQLHGRVECEDTDLGQAFLMPPATAACGEKNSADTCHDYSVSR